MQQAEKTHQKGLNVSILIAVSSFEIALNYPRLLIPHTYREISSKFFIL